MHRDALGARPAEGGQPVADLLEACIEADAEPRNVMTKRHGGRVDCLIGHDQRAGEIAGEGALQSRGCMR